MRALLLLPVTIALFSASPAASQDAPRVLFCSGPCFAVDANGVRTPAPKGTELKPNQRFETGPGGYAQIKLGPDAAVALGDNARARIDPVRVQEPVVVNLDAGRARMLTRDVTGRPTRPVELNTVDGRFLLRNADVEVKKAQLPTREAVTVMKVNAGTASLRSGTSLITMPTTTVQAIGAGKIMTQPIAASELMLAPPPSRVRAAPISSPVATAPLPDIAPARGLRGDLPVAAPIRDLPITATAPVPGTMPTAPAKPPVVRGELIPRLPIITPTGEVMTLTTYVLTDPVLTSSTTTKSLELVDTSTSLTSINLTTTTTTSTDTTVTTISTSPTLLTTTTTTSTLTTSPTTSTITSPLLVTCCTR